MFPGWEAAPPNAGVEPLVAQLAASIVVHVDLGFRGFGGVCRPGWELFDHNRHIDRSFDQLLGLCGCLRSGGSGRYSRGVGIAWRGRPVSCLAITADQPVAQSLRKETG